MNERGIPILVVGFVAMFLLLMFFVVAVVIKKEQWKHEATMATKQLSSYTFEDHKWVVFGESGLYHHPDCPCKDAPKDEGGGP